MSNYEETRLKTIRDYYESGCECLLFGRMARSVASDAIAVEYYHNNCKCSRNCKDASEDISPCICVTNINDYDTDTGEKKYCHECNNTGQLTQVDRDV